MKTHCTTAPAAPEEVRSICIDDGIYADPSDEIVLECRTFQQAHPKAVQAPMMQIDLRESATAASSAAHPLEGRKFGDRRACRL
jgi:hypothetical protein